MGLVLRAVGEPGGSCQSESLIMHGSAKEQVLITEIATPDEDIKSLEAGIAEMQIRLTRAKENREKETEHTRSGPALMTLKKMVQMVASGEEKISNMPRLALGGIEE